MSLQLVHCSVVHISAGRPALLLSRNSKETSTCTYLLLLLQELVGIMAASKGLVLMAPPSSNNEARKTMAALLSAIKPKTKVCCGSLAV
jgi:hypothetical protein